LRQTGPGGTAAGLPVTVVASRSRDSAVVSSGLRYGVARGLEISAALRSLWLSQPRGLAGNEEEHGYTLELGASYLLAAEADGPAALLSFSLDAHQQGGFGPGDNNWRLSTTLWRSVEPVVLSLDVGYDYRAGRDLDGYRMDPGDRLFLAPRINFAVNHQVTLIGGLGLYYLQADRFAGEVIAGGRHSSDLLLGVGLAPDPRSTVFIQSRMALGQESSASVALDWRYRF
jgi:hypothetical protein